MFNQTYDAAHAQGLENGRAIEQMSGAGEWTAIFSNKCSRNFNRGSAETRNNMDISKLTVETRYTFIVDYVFGGWHHVYKRKRCGNGIEFKTQHCLASYDIELLTRLVLAAHAMFVRVELANGGPGRLKIMLHPRQPRRDGDDMWTRHPSLDELADKAAELKGQKEAMIKRAEAELMARPVPSTLE